MFYEDMSFDTHTIAERKIQEAIADGAFDNLPGKGKPLDLGSEAATPPELRAAHRILKNPNVSPDWIQLDKHIRTSIAECQEMQIRLDRDCKKLGTREKHLLIERYISAIKRVNNEILKYYFIAPTCTQTHIPFRIEEENARVREILA